MKMVMSLCLFGFIFTIQSFGQVGGKLILKSGAVVEYSEARVEGATVTIILPHGTMRLSVSAISDTSLRKLGVDVGPTEVLSTTIPISTATPEMTPNVTPAGKSNPALRAISSATPGGSLQELPVAGLDGASGSLPSIEGGEPEGSPIPSKEEKSGSPSATAIEASVTPSPTEAQSISPPTVVQKPLKAALPNPGLWKHLPRALVAPPNAKPQKFKTKKSNLR